MAKAPDISDAEWEVMRVLWQRSPLTASEVVDALANHREWTPATIKTLLNRLVGKGALGFETQGKRYLYHPKVGREECVRRESRSFLSRVFGTSPGPMLVQFVKEAQLTDAEIRELKQILKEKRP
jgi:BlaI family transcriptional regulator, penicillinase repressor